MIHGSTEEVRTQIEDDTPKENPTNLPYISFTGGRVGCAHLIFFQVETVKTKQNSEEFPRNLSVQKVSFCLF